MFKLMLIIINHIKYNLQDFSYTKIITLNILLK